jgi:glycogen phosphorylase
VFLPNYGVGLAETIIPAADLSEQISTAGTEASGTGNMKLALNGALTIGTWDGATIEMAEAIGAEDFFIFGLRVEEITALKASATTRACTTSSRPRAAPCARCNRSGAFSPGDPARHRELIDGLLQRDRYFLLADFAAYREAQAQADAALREPAEWAGAALRNIAGMGHFSTDRCVPSTSTVWSRAALAAGAAWSCAAHAG